MDKTSSYLPFTRPTIDDETIEGVVQVLRSGWLATGPQVKNFEDMLADYLSNDLSDNLSNQEIKKKRIIKSFTSATAGLEIALQICGIGEGDEVITSALSFAATSNVIMRVGAKPIFVDVDLDTRNIKLEDIPKVITKKTKAIMPVHFAGLAVDMDKLYSYAREYNLRVIEDAAHAIGSSWRGKKIGSFGDLVVFSFHPNKNMTTIEGGAISLASDCVDEAKKVELHRWHGLTKDTQNNTDVVLAGGKSNLSDVAARVGIGQLKRLDEFNKKRRELVAVYYELLCKNSLLNNNVCLPAYPKETDGGMEGHSFHMFAPLICFDKLKISRQQFISDMQKKGIGVGIHYPAIHLFELYRKLGYREGAFANAERIGNTTVTLPLFPAMQRADVERVCETMNELFDGYSGRV
ncbi:MAG: DegT/DnrJ/EryC1/StrS aminotransferase family protein [Oligoflexia bacterium]|nr:DegT/DnrJ/EryC1/StrS aminotransferase family protein [Oligoflexia bacterium]